MWLGNLNNYNVGQSRARCWWVVNALGGPDETPRLMSRSLATLRIELHGNRIATSLKLQREFENRLCGNADAVAVLHEHMRVWEHFRGPDPNALKLPSQTDLESAQHCTVAIRQYLDEAHGSTDDDDIRAFGPAIVKAVEGLSLVTWEAIRRENFWITPSGLYGAYPPKQFIIRRNIINVVLFLLVGELVKYAVFLLDRRAGEHEARRLRLDAIPQGDEDSQNQDDDNMEPQAESSRRDRFGLDLDDFMCKSPRTQVIMHLLQYRIYSRYCNRKEDYLFFNLFPIMRRPRNYARAVTLASEIHLDEMKTLLEMHYDTVHLEAFKSKKTVGRKSEYKVFNTVAQSHRKPLNQRTTLPQEFKRIFRSPADEGNWNRLSEFKDLLLRIAQGETQIIITAEQANKLANAIGTKEDNDNLNEIEKGIIPGVPEGSRITSPALVGEHLKSSSRKKQFADRVRNEGDIIVLTRPFESKNKPLVDNFVIEIASDTTWKKLKKSPNPEPTFDKMLIC